MRPPTVRFSVEFTRLRTNVRLAVLGMFSAICEDYIVRQDFVLCDNLIFKHGGNHIEEHRPLHCGRILPHLRGIHIEELLPTIEMLGKPFGFWVPWILSEYIEAGESHGIPRAVELNMELSPKCKAVAFFSNNSKPLSSTIVYFLSHPLHEERLKYLCNVQGMDS